MPIFILNKNKCVWQGFSKKRVVAITPAVSNVEYLRNK